MSSSSCRIKYLYEVRDERIFDRDLPSLLSVSVYHGVVPRAEVTDKLARAEDLSNYKVCHPGEIVINRMSAYQGALGMARQYGIVSPEYIVLRPNPEVDPRFLTYLFKSSWFVAEMTARVRGIGSTDQGNVRTPRINPDDLGDIRVELPSLAGQRALADYLDAETARIDALIEKKQRMMQLSVERWNSLLEGAFGSEVGLPLKRLLRSSPAYGVLVPDYDPEGVPMLRIMDLKSEGVDLDSVTRISPSLSAQYRRTVLRAGDVVVSVVGTLGRSIEVDSALSGCNINRPLARVQLLPEVPRNLVRYWFGSPSFQRMAQMATSSDSAQPTLGMEDLSNLIVGIPNDPTECKDLALRLEVHERRINTVLDRLSKQVSLLSEHRQALITAAVSGELNGPGVAA